MRTIRTIPATQCSPWLNSLDTLKRCPIREDILWWVPFRRRGVDTAAGDCCDILIAAPSASGKGSKSRNRYAGLRFRQA